MIDHSSLPCYVRIANNEDQIFLVSYIDYRYPKNLRYYHDGSWVCNEADNPQVLITLAEIAAYFPERLI